MRPTPGRVSSSRTSGVGGITPVMSWSMVAILGSRSMVSSWSKSVRRVSSGRPGQVLPQKVTPGLTEQIADGVLRKTPWRSMAAWIRCFSAVRRSPFILGIRSSRILFRVSA